MNTVTAVLAMLVVLALLGAIVDHQRLAARNVAMEERNRRLQEFSNRLRQQLLQRDKQIDNLRFSLDSDQDRRILESLGWRPLTGESLPGDGEQIVVAGVQTTRLRQAPNGYHYARFKRQQTGEVQLTASVDSQLVIPLDGSVLWLPQAALVS